MPPPQLRGPRMAVIPTGKATPIMVRRFGITTLTASPPLTAIRAQSQVFGPRPGGADGTRQDRMYAYYRTAMSSPGSPSSRAAVVTLWAIANAQVDPGQPSEGKQNNPAATRNDAKQALSVLGSQGWVNANSANPSYPATTTTPPPASRGGPGVAVQPPPAAKPPQPSSTIKVTAPPPGMMTTTDQGFAPPSNILTTFLNRATAVLAPAQQIADGTVSVDSGGGTGGGTDVTTMTATSAAPAAASAGGTGAAAVAASSTRKLLVWGGVAAGIVGLFLLVRDA